MAGTIVRVGVSNAVDLLAEGFDLGAEVEGVCVDAAVVGADAVFRRAAT